MWDHLCSTYMAVDNICRICSYGSYFNPYYKYLLFKFQHGYISRLGFSSLYLASENNVY